MAGIEPGASYSGEVSFTVAADKTCLVAMKHADGTYTVLPCTTVDGEHRYTVTVADADVTVVVVYKGDVDLSGGLNAKDATLVKQAYLKLATLNKDAALQTLLCDVSGDGKFNAKDATAAKQAYLKLITLEW